MSAHPHPGSGASQQSFLTLVADDLTGRLPEIVREMRDHLADNIGELNADPQLVEMPCTTTTSQSGPITTATLTAAAAM